MGADPGAEICGAAAGECGVVRYNICVDAWIARQYEVVMASLKLRAVGNSVGVVLPKDLLSRLQLSEGDTLQVIEAPDGLRLRRSDPEFDRQMEIAREVMRRRRAVLAALAK